MHGYSAMDIRKQQMSMDGYPCFYRCQSSIIHAFMNIHFDILGLLWISMHLLAMDFRSRDLHFPISFPLFLKSLCRNGQLIRITKFHGTERYLALPA